MKPISAAFKEVAKRARHYEWHWCRRKNGFCDLPRWRQVAARLGMPIYQVVAFANRIEELANDAGNKGYERGEVGHFDAGEFAAALGMPADEAARIFAELEAVGWVAFGHVADFHDRNKDSDQDVSAAMRQRKKTRRERIGKTLAKHARLGLIENAERSDIERRLMDMSEEQLNAVVDELALRELSTGPPITRDSRHHVIVTVEKSTEIQAQPVDNSGATTRGGEAGPSEEGSQGIAREDGRERPDGGDPQAQAQLWLQSTGVKIVTQRMDEPATLAATRVERWLHQRLDGDAATLKAIIEAVRASDLTPARFLTEIGNAIERARARPQPHLPLGPGLVSTRSGTDG